MEQEEDFMDEEENLRIRRKKSMDQEEKFVGQEENMYG